MCILHTEVHSRAYRSPQCYTNYNFDQPLWWKTLMITVTEPIGSGLRSIVLRLGRFYTEMSYVGCMATYGSIWFAGITRTNICT